jgi:hypothetical protein
MMRRYLLALAILFAFPATGALANYFAEKFGVR